ncbi:MAG TPA: translocation/assembly module TamB domain-containing protein, partial [Burkholderiaceae bacterium]|nr:translocation/assembly module TamB domain-containing protein [Burkholderiaceae bacterium]
MLSATGAWQPGDAAAPFALRGTWQALRWPLTGEPQARSPQGSFAAQGTINRYRFDLEGMLDLAYLGRLTLHSRGDGDREGLAIAAAEAQWLDGQLTASGQVHWTPELRWQLQLAGRDLDPGVLHPDWPGRLALHAASHGHYGKRLDAELRIEELAGTLRNKPWRLTGGASISGEQYTLEALELRAGGARLQATGRVDKQWELAWQLAAPDLADLLPNSSGGVSASGRLSGARQQPYVNAQLSARSLAWRDDRAAVLDATVELDLADRVDSRITLQVEELRARGLDLDHVEFNAQGRLADHRLRASARRADAHARLEAAGGLQARQWRGTLLNSDVGNARVGAWRQREPVAIEVGRDAFALALLCLEQNAYHACVDGTGRAAHGGRASMQLAGVPLAVLEPWVGAGVRLEGRVTGQTRLAVATDGGLDGDLALDVGAGALRLDEAGEAATAVEIDGITLRARAAADRLQTTATLTLTGAGAAHAELDMPFAPFKAKPANDHALRGTLRAQFDELGLLAIFAPELLQPRGHLQLQVELGGSLESPEVRGEARLEQGRAGVAGLGITLEDVRASARGDNAHRIVVRAEARSGPGTLNVDGQIELGTEAPWHTQLQLRGQNFEAVHTPGYMLIVSPDLRLRAQPRTLRAGAQTSPDVVVLGAGPEARAGQVAVNANVHVLLGRQVRVMTSNIDAYVEGDVFVHDTPAKPTTASGELRVTRGIYRAYGKDLDIDRGRLIFTGGAVDDPEVDLRAVRRVENVTAGIQARGRLQKPEVTLFS